MTARGGTRQLTTVSQRATKVGRPSTGGDPHA